MANGVYDPLVYRHPRTLREAWPDRYDHTENYSNPRAWWAKRSYAIAASIVLVLFVGCHVLYNLYGR